MIQISRFRANTPDVVYETIEQETIIVNMNSAMYFSVRGTAGEIWALIEAGTPVPQISAVLAERYSGGRDEIEASTNHFIAQLEVEGLIVPAEDAVATAIVQAPAVSQANKPRFEQATLDKYSDMEDLLLLDPMHTA